MSALAAFIAACDAMGFNADEPINGADTVDLIADHLPALREQALCDELAAYCTRHQLPLISADELLHSLNESQRAEHGAWLVDFINRWEAWERGA